MLAVRAILHTQKCSLLESMFLSMKLSFLSATIFSRVKDIDWSDCSSAFGSDSSFLKHVLVYDSLNHCEKEIRYDLH